MDDSKKQVFRVVYKHGNMTAPVVFDEAKGEMRKKASPNTPLSTYSSIPTISLPPSIIHFCMEEVGIAKKRATEIVNRLSPFVRLVDDDSGQCYFVKSQKLSHSSIYEFIEYFFRSQNFPKDREVRERPVDTKEFLSVLKLGRIPASWLNYVRIK